MDLKTCSQCHVRVIPSKDGICPSCRSPIQTLTENLEVAATDSNPYESPASDQANGEDSDQSRLIHRGGWLFLCIVGVNLLPLLWAGITNQPIGNPGLGTFLSLALLYFLWRGQRWAKWITILLFLPSAVLLIPVAYSQGNVQLLIGGGLLAAVTVMLLFSKSLNAFLLEQRYRV